jgi:TRAP transporter TAXI family solute receptor
VQATIPKGTYRTTTDDVRTFGGKATFVTTSRLSDDVVYEVTRATFEGLVSLRSLHPAFARLDPARMIRDGLSTPLHPGAMRYYRGRGWM